ncbi:predicted protein, partial [Nematostella vectensis]
VWSLEEAEPCATLFSNDDNISLHPRLQFDGQFITCASEAGIHLWNFENLQLVRLFEDSPAKWLVEYGELFTLFLDASNLHITRTQSQRIITSFPLPPFRRSVRGSNFTSGFSDWLNSLNPVIQDKLVFAASMPDHSILLLKFSEVTPRRLILAVLLGRKYAKQQAIVEPNKSDANNSIGFETKTAARTHEDLQGGDNAEEDNYSDIDDGEFSDSEEDFVLNDLDDAIDSENEDAVDNSILQSEGEVTLRSARQATTWRGCRMSKPLSYYHQPHAAPLEHRTLFQLLDHHASKFPNKEAIIYRDENNNRKSLTFQEYRDQFRVLAAKLTELGLRRGHLVLALPGMEVKVLDEDGNVVPVGTQ